MATKKTNVNETAQTEAVNDPKLEAVNSAEAEAVNDTDMEAEAENLPQSEKLDGLYIKQSEAAVNMAKFAVNPRSKNYQQAAANLVQINAEIEAEISAIRKAEADAKIAEAKNERIKLADNLIEAVKTFTADASAENEAAMNTARELVVNELLLTVRGSKPAKAVNENGKPKTGKIAEAIIRDYLALPVRDKKAKAILEAEPYNYAKATIWHALNDAEADGTIGNEWR